MSHRRKTTIPRKLNQILMALATCAVGWAGAVDARRAGYVATPTATAETAPVPHGGDAADDPAIWVHPTSPELSLILGTDKQGGLHAYNLDGSEHAKIALGSKPNNVDVIYAVNHGTSRVDLAVASTRATNAGGLYIWMIDPRARALRSMTPGRTLKVLGGAEPYGCCGFRSSKTGDAHVFITSKDGHVQQLRLQLSSNGTAEVHPVGEFKFDSTIEGCVVDEQLAYVYFGEESHGIWKAPAEPGSHRVPHLIAKVGDNGLSKDVEGLTIYRTQDGQGYLIASSQGNNQFKIYERGGANRFIGTIDPVPGRFSDVEDTDGIDITSASLGPLFPHGMFVVQDGDNGQANQNFKMFRWEQIAGTNLIVARPRQ
jgi:3-phytase